MSKSYPFVDITTNSNKEHEPCVVHTKQELQAAIDCGEPDIIVEGELAENLKKTRSIAFLSAPILAAVIAGIRLAPATGGVSLVAAAPVAALTGLEIAVIVLAASIGIALILAVYNGHDVEFETDLKTGEIKMKLRKKSATSQSGELQN